MRHLVAILTIICTLTATTVRAQYASINVDYKTMEAMAEAFTTEAAMEALHNENLQKIYDSYKAAEVASAGIFSSKYLDRKALTNLNLWDDKKENYYYTRIYNIVTKRIIPKTITCAQMMVEDPATAIYWGSYLLKTTEDVKSLCQQFESVVTNSTLSFQDIAFLEIVNDLKAIFNITNLGGIDWKNMFEHLADDIEGSFTKENLEKDLDNLIGKGVGLAGAGYAGGVDGLLKGTSFGGTFQQKMGSILTLIDNASGMYADFKNLSTQQVLTRLVGEDKVNNLFDISDYNLTKWIDDYAKAPRANTTPSECTSTAGMPVRKCSVTIHRLPMTMPSSMAIIGIASTPPMPASIPVPRSTRPSSKTPRAMPAGAESVWRNSMRRIRHTSIV